VTVPGSIPTQTGSAANVLGYLERGQEEGGRLVTGGSRADGADGEFSAGDFAQPTIFADVDATASHAFNFAE